MHFNLTTLYQRAGETDKAREAAARFEQLSAQEKQSSDREARVAVTYKRGVELLQSGQMGEAQAVFEDTLEIDPSHALTQSMLAKIAFSKGDVPTALQWIERAVENDDSVAEFHYLEALFELRRENPQASLEAANRALELDPALADAWSMVGTLLLDAGRAREAVTCFEKASALEPSNESVQLNLASAYAAVGDGAGEARAMDRYKELTRNR